MWIRGLVFGIFDVFSTLGLFMQDHAPPEVDLNLDSRLRWTELSRLRSGLDLYGAIFLLDIAAVAARKSRQIAAELNK